MQIIAHRTDLERAIAALIEADGRFADIHAGTGLPPLRRSEGGYCGMMKIIAGQQVSRAGAAAIWTRMQDALSPMEPKHVAGLGEKAFRSAGLSGPKIAAVNALTSAVLSGALEFEALETCDDRAAVDALCAVKGIGPWSAEIYLLSCLGRSDAWPGGDLALQVAAADAFGLARRPDSRAMTTMAERWRPWRSAAARLLWAHYALLPGRRNQEL